MNWNHEKVMALISCKHKEHITLKNFIDAHANTIFTTQQWNKSLKDLQTITHSKILEIGKMCKDKWNYINGSYNKILDYYKGIGHNISYQDFAMEEWDKFHLPK